MKNNFQHLELTTGDTAAAMAFYKKVFAWKFKALPEMNYTMIDTGSESGGGGIAGKQDPNQPTAWMPYVTVKSVKETVGKAEAAGAHVAVPFMSLGDMGAIGIFTDPTGGTIGVWEAGAAPPKPAKPAKKAAAKKAPAKKAAAKKAPAKKPPAKKAKGRR